MKRPLPDRKAAARRAALRALAKAKRAADKAGVTLSDWEDEFLGSVAERVKTYGRAFGDPEKGDPNAPLSVMQAVKLKQITVKAQGDKGKDDKSKGDRPKFSRSRRRPPPRPARQLEDE